MNKNYEQPNVQITKLQDDVIRTSAPGVGNFNPDWLGFSGEEENSTPTNW